MYMKLLADCFNIPVVPTKQYFQTCIYHTLHQIILCQYLSETILIFKNYILFPNRFGRSLRCCLAYMCRPIGKALRPRWC